MRELYQKVAEVTEQAIQVYNEGQAVPTCS